MIDERDDTAGGGDVSVVRRVEVDVEVAAGEAEVLHVVSVGIDVVVFGAELESIDC